MLTVMSTSRGPAGIPAQVITHSVLDPCSARLNTFHGDRLDSDVDDVAERIRSMLERVVPETAYGVLRALVDSGLVRRIGIPES